MKCDAEMVEEQANGEISGVENIAREGETLPSARMSFIVAGIITRNRREYYWLGRVVRQ